MVAAYEQLTIEGYLIARQGAATRVAPLVHTEAPAPTPIVPPTDRPPIRHNFVPGEPDGSLFPTTAWTRSLRRAVSDLDPASLGYGDSRGTAELRDALAIYLGRARAVSTTASGLRIFAGASVAFGFLGEAFLRRGITHIAIEDPYLPTLRNVLSLVGLTVVPIPIDDEGIDVERLAASPAQAVVVTPAHQYPLGITMSAARRAALIEWARHGDRWIIEDDYDGEFRFDRSAIGALQGLDPDRVIYVGTASKSLAPGLRLAWTTVPRSLRADMNMVCQLRSLVSTFEQHAMADFLSTGAMDRHLRQVRTEYARRQLLIRELIAEAAPWLQVSPSPAGLHIAATITDAAIGEQQLIAAGQGLGVGLFGFGPHWTGPPSREGLVLGYTRMPVHGVAAGFARLGDLLQSIG